MSALMTRRRRSPARDRDHRQASLFSQIVSPAAPLRDGEPGTLEAPSPEAPKFEPAAPATAERSLEAPVPGTADRSLEAAITALWDDLVAGEIADCPVCGEAMEPRHSVGAGVVGGRCTSCATTIA